MKKNLLGKISAAAFIFLSLTACQKDMASKNGNDLETNSASFRSNSQEAPSIIFYALGGTTLDKYSTSNPETIIKSVKITGLQSGESISGIDFRPLNGQLFALGSNSRLYTIEPATGVATFVAALSTVPTGSSTAVPLSLSGTSFGFDFNPTVDRIRIVSNTGQNLRVNPTNGVTLVDGNINPSGASVNGVAYTNNDNDPTTGTNLFALDVTTDLLYSVIPPNAGTLVEPLSVKLKLEGDGGFDIAPRNANVTTDVALALYEVNKKSTLFLIDVLTGDTRILAKYKKDIIYTGFAISPEL